MSHKFFLIMTLSLALPACQSVYEKQGDEHLAERDGLSALNRYQIVEKENKGSSEFPAKLTEAYILGLGQTADSQGDPEIILTYREKIMEALPRLSNKKLERLYVQTIAAASERIVSIPNPRFRDLCKTFIQDIRKYGASQDINRKMDWVAEIIRKKEEEIEQKMQASAARQRMGK